MSDPMRHPPLILASGSAARRAMLTAAGVPFAACPARPGEVDEPALLRDCAGLAVADAALRLAEAKARAVAARCPGALVIGADSIVETEDGANGGQWLEKPGSIAGLIRQLRQLRGRRHRIVSAVAVVGDGVACWRHAGVATLVVRDFSDQWLADYVQRCGEQVMHSVGGYHVEGQGVQLFERIDGDHFTIRGLPLVALLGYLRGIGQVMA